MVEYLALMIAAILGIAVGIAIMLVIKALSSKPPTPAGWLSYPVPPPPFENVAGGTVKTRIDQIRAAQILTKGACPAIPAALWIQVDDLLGKYEDPTAHGIETTVELSLFLWIAWDAAEKGAKAANSGDCPGAGQQWQVAVDELEHGASGMTG